MVRADDLAPLLAPQSGPAVGFRQGVIVSYDPTTGANTVAVGGSILTNLALLNTSEALLLVPGAVVGILTTGATWCILGRLTIPGTPDALTALASIRAGTGAYSGSASVIATSYAPPPDGEGPSVPDVLIGPTRRCMVIVSAGISYQFPATGSRAAYMSFSVSGAGSFPASDSNALYVSSGGTDGVPLAASYVALLTPDQIPAAGIYHFTAEYRVSAGTMLFDSRHLIVVPL